MIVIHKKFKGRISPKTQAIRTQDLYELNELIYRKMPSFEGSFLGAQAGAQDDTLSSDAVPSSTITLMLTQTRITSANR